MSTVILHPAGRDDARWRLPNTDGSEALVVSLDDGHTWHPLGYEDGEWVLRVQGERALPLDPNAVTLPSGLHGALIKAEASGLILLRDAGAVLIESECTEWPVDWSACGGAPEDPDLRARAEYLATTTLRALTLGRVGGCPITVRPCAQGCVDAHLPGLGRLPFFPHIGPRGRWVNSCGCSGSCHCGQAMSSVVLDTPIGRIDEVIVRGVVLDPSSYRAEGGRLYRLDGEPWPACQDFSQPYDGEDAFSITYLNAYPVTYAGAVAAGVLAQEYAKACSGRSCSLPPGVVSLSRQGVSMEFARDLFDGGLTGIREVDVFTSQYNPNRLRVRPMVYSPDLVSPRRVPR